MAQKRYNSPIFSKAPMDGFVPNMV